MPDRRRFSAHAPPRPRHRREPRPRRRDRARTLPTHDLLLGATTAASLESVLDELPSATAWPVNVTDYAAVAAACAEIERLDVLVHNAGVADLGTIAESTVAQWRTTLEANVVAVAELTRLLLPALRTSRGHVVLINSGAGGTRAPDGRRTRRASSRCEPSATYCALRNPTCGSPRCSRVASTPTCSAQSSPARVAPTIRRPS